MSTLLASFMVFYFYCLLCMMSVSKFNICLLSSLYHISTNHVRIDREQRYMYEVHLYKIRSCVYRVLLEHLRQVGITIVVILIAFVLLKIQKLFVMQLCFLHYLVALQLVSWLLVCVISSNLGSYPLR